MNKDNKGTIDHGLLFFLGFLFGIAFCIGAGLIYEDSKPKPTVVEQDVSLSVCIGLVDHCVESLNQCNDLAEDAINNYKECVASD